MGTNPDDIKGRAKVAAGAVIGDKDLEREGRMDRATGQAKEQLDKVADLGRDAVTSAQDAASGLADKGREVVDTVVEKAKEAVDKAKSVATKKDA